jgi:acyl dehydratase
VALAGIDNIRAVTPVRIGDTLHTNVEVTSSRESRRAEHGQVTLAYEVLNQHKTRVMTFEVRLVLRRSTDNATRNGVPAPVRTRK